MIVSVPYYGVLFDAGLSHFVSVSCLPPLQGPSGELLRLATVPAPGYHPFFYYLNDLYNTLKAAFLLHVTRAGLLEILLLILACCAGWVACRRYSRPELQGQWILDVALMERKWIEAGGDAGAIGILRQQWGLGPMTYAVSEGNLTVRGQSLTISFSYETLSVTGDITTGLLDRRMVIMMWAPRRASGRIISMRRASDREIMTVQAEAARA